MELSLLRDITLILVQGSSTSSIYIYNYIILYYIIFFFNIIIIDYILSY